MLFDRAMETEGRKPTFAVSTDGIAEWAMGDLIKKRRRKCGEKVRQCSGRTFRRNDSIAEKSSKT
jgi:hypothetical protein